MRLLIFLSIFFIGGQTVSHYDLIREQWQSYKTTFNKRYETETEEHFRMKIFADNAHKVDKHNQLYAQGLVDFELGINQFSDLLFHEFDDMMNRLQPSNITNETKAATFMPSRFAKIPDEFDWREKGAVTPVKDQEQCGSCYSFCATGSLEGQYFRKTGKLVSLSEQNIVDCSQKFGNNGCDGGSVPSSFLYIFANEGVDTEESYPYEGEVDKCRYDPKNKGATDKGYALIKPGDEEMLRVAVATVGPISVSIDASHDSFQQFKSKGVYFEPDCSPTHLTHGVLIVGYGTTEDGTDYWLVKNSWGTTWGDEGYMKLSRNRDNHCGIAAEPRFPVV